LYLHTLGSGGEEKKKSGGGGGVTSVDPWGCGGRTYPMMVRNMAR
jgi:hypothetical protein